MGRLAMAMFPLVLSCYTKQIMVTSNSLGRSLPSGWKTYIPTALLSLARGLLKQQLFLLTKPKLPQVI